MFRRAFSAAAVFGFGWGGAGQKEQFEVGREVKMPNISVLRPEKALKNDVLVSRKIVNELDKTKLNIRLYQYETCPFCCKVRAYLDYHGFSYEVVEVNPVTRSQIKFSTDYKKVPIVRVNDEFSLTESSLVVSQLATLLVRPERTLEEIRGMYPSVESTDEKGKAVQLHPNKYFVMMEKNCTAAEMAAAKEEREWREWVDEHFIHLISPNVYRTFPEALETFRWFQEVGDWHRTFPSWERCLAVYSGALVMWGIAGRLKKKYNIVDERKAMADACDKWMAAIGPTRKFMGGDRPNLADLSLYGAMQSFYGCTAFQEVCSSGPISEWYARMKSAVEKREGAYLLAARK
ncbi:hypothetical protein PFISCL1PPCAC_24614 [Pristionchus fissidentatus]|uniref:Prostaglandin E synthase 2 n=1 Tax=Pristionchus fissidentatus TaxID=1538716 RepID=A0AAV5WQI3_9BILA|nr:hypothetical protein PFISCL1PPCAC_24614 [Pristionchus fissidentatus]